ncbi:MAG: DUF5615 family PIN-like protein [Thermodesulfobacteriota bacterium]
MKLLLDQNISYRLVADLKELIPELSHVKFLDLFNADDIDIWNFAKAEKYTIVTFDSDFYELQALKGFPPKIIWFRFGNTTRIELTDFFIENVKLINEFMTLNEFVDSGCLEFK